jgi:hypothetical protein
MFTSLVPARGVLVGNDEAPTKIIACHHGCCGERDSICAGLGHGHWADLHEGQSVLVRVPDECLARWSSTRNDGSDNVEVTATDHGDGI